VTSQHSSLIIKRCIGIDWLIDHTNVQWIRELDAEVDAHVTNPMDIPACLCTSNDTRSVLTALLPCEFNDDDNDGSDVTVVFLLADYVCTSSLSHIVRWISAPAVASWCSQVAVMTSLCESAHLEVTPFRFEELARIARERCIAIGNNSIDMKLNIQYYPFAFSALTSELFVTCFDAFPLIGGRELKLMHRRQNDLKQQYASYVSTDDAQTDASLRSLLTKFRVRSASMSSDTNGFVDDGDDDDAGDGGAGAGAGDGGAEDDVNENVDAYEDQQQNGNDNDNDNDNEANGITNDDDEKHNNAMAHSNQNKSTDSFVGLQAVSRVAESTFSQLTTAAKRLIKPITSIEQISLGYLQQLCGNPIFQLSSLEDNSFDASTAHDYVQRLSKCRVNSLLSTCHSLASMLVQLNVVPNVHSIGTTAGKMSKQVLRTYRECTRDEWKADPSVESRGDATVILLDRTLDLVTPMLHQVHPLDTINRCSSKPDTLEIWDSANFDTSNDQLSHWLAVLLQQPQKEAMNNLRSELLQIIQREGVKIGVREQAGNAKPAELDTLVGHIESVRAVFNRHMTLCRLTQLLTQTLRIASSSWDKLTNVEKILLITAADDGQLRHEPLLLQIIDLLRPARISRRTSSSDAKSSSHRPMVPIKSVMELACTCQSLVSGIDLKDELDGTTMGLAAFRDALAEACNQHGVPPELLSTDDEADPPSVEAFAAHFCDVLERMASTRDSLSCSQLKRLHDSEATLTGMPRKLRALFENTNHVPFVFRLLYLLLTDRDEIGTDLKSHSSSSVDEFGSTAISTVYSAASSIFGSLGFRSTESAPGEAPFVIVYVVGGVSFAEAHAIKTLFQGNSSNTTVLVGGTGIAQPSTIVERLCTSSSWK
jgi:Sec1 family